jgi:glucose-6-phosphate dehydrogenase assembly protein OpcA
MQLFEDELFGNIPVPAMASEGTNTLKASLFTLIVVVKDAERTLYLQRLVNLITKKFPCKVVFIAIDSESRESFLRQNASTRIVGNGSNAIAYDVLTIETSHNQQHRVPFLVIPEILADLPAFLLIGHDPSEVKTIVDQLESCVGRIVFDVIHLQDIGRFAEEILALPNKQKYVDINWARTKPWRETLSRVFNTKEALSLLSLCNRLDIRYSRRPMSTENSSPDTQPIFLQAWLASRLGWIPVCVEENNDHMLVRYSLGSREISVILTPTDSNVLEEGNIASIEIRGDNDIHYLLAYERDDRHIVIHASSQDHCEMPYSVFVGSFQRGRALPSEIFLQAASEHYLPMIELLSSHLWERNRNVHGSRLLGTGQE